MSTETLLLLVVIVVLIGAFPVWPHSRSWGYTPSGVLIFLLVVFLIWAISQDRPLFRSSARDVGQDIQSAGRDVADSVRDAVR